MLIINAYVKTMDIAEYKNGYVYIENGKIAEVGNMSDLKVNCADIIDAKGATLLPGFIDAHCHMGVFGDGIGFEGDDANEDVDPITPHLRAIDAVNALDNCFNEAIAAGVTTVLTGAGSANPIAGQWLAMKTVGNRVDDMVIASPIGMKFALGENPKVSYNQKNQSPITRMAIAALIREQLQKAKRYMQDKADAELDEDTDEPEYDIKCEALIPALKREIKSFFHAHRADDIFTAIRIAKEFELDYVIVHCTEGHLIAEELKKENASVILGPIICDRSKPELSNQTPKNAGVLQKVGLTVAICTDHPETPIQYLSLSAAVASKDGLPYDEALRSITINAAKVAGLDNRLGSIAVGKDADLVLIDGDPLQLLSPVTAVIIDGKRVR